MSIMSEVNRMSKHLRNPGFLFKKPKDPLGSFSTDRRQEAIDRNVKRGRVGAKGKL
jgi:hypothetical protein